MELGLEPRSAPKKNKGSGSFPEGLGIHPSGAVPGREAPTIPLLVHPCILVFQCPWHGVVAAAAPALGCKPSSASSLPCQLNLPLHGSSGGQRWLLPVKAVRPPSCIAPQHQTQTQLWPRGRRCSWAATLGAKLPSRSHWSHVSCLNAL